MARRVAWKGIVSAIATPFREDGTVDEPAFRALLELGLAEGLHGFAVAGSTGEWFSLTDAERERLFAIAVEHVAGRALVIAGVSAIGTDQAVALARGAKRAGCDGVLALPPPYALPTPREVKGHFEAIAGAGMPIMVYNNPPRTGIDLKGERIAEIARLDAVVAMKDSIKDLYQMTDTLERIGDRVAYFVGPEPYLQATLPRGAVGTVSVVANLDGRLLVDYDAHATAGRTRQAYACERRIEAFWNLVTRLGFGVYPTVKAAMALLGRPAGTIRRPFLPLPGDDRERLGREMAAIGFAMPSARATP